MSFAAPRHLRIVLLLLAAVLYRGLIPAQMVMQPQVAALGGSTLLATCHHGDDAVRDDGKSGSATTTCCEQCALCAAAGPALPSTKVALDFAPGVAQIRSERRTIVSPEAASHLTPPVRGPPSLS